MYVYIYIYIYTHTTYVGGARRRVRRGEEAAGGPIYYTRSIFKLIISKFGVCVTQILT